MKFKNKYLPFIIIGVVLLIGGAFFHLNNTKINHGESTNNTPVAQSHRSYELDITQKPNANQITLNKPAIIKYKIKNDQGEIVKDFATPHEKLMHFIIVRKDLTQFQHLHPTFDKNTGEFSVNVVFNVNGPYRFFADFTPDVKDNPQGLPVVLESDINVGDASNFKPQPLIVDTNSEKVVLPDYQVSYTFPSELTNMNPASYILTVEKNNQPITLETYLAALGHSVILKEGTLEYIHAHAGEAKSMGDMGHSMGSMQQESAPNKINFATTFPTAGKYKIFTQFKHQGKVLTTDYTVEVK